MTLLHNHTHTHKEMTTATSLFLPTQQQELLHQMLLCSGNKLGKKNGMSRS